MSNIYKGKREKINAYTHDYNNRAMCLTDNVTVGLPYNLLQGYSCNAIWDTGASQTTISLEIAQKLNLPVISMKEVCTANGKYIATVHYVSLTLPNKVGFHNVMVTASKLVSPIDVLIGMDIITCGDFAISNFNGVTKINFRIPSCGDIDYVQWLKNKDSSLKQNDKTDRNALCPCGSLKKFKNCCTKSQ